MSRKMLVLSIYDAAIEEYMQPFYSRTRDEAKRMVLNSLTEDSQLMKHPKDFTVFVVGVFDAFTGEMSGHAPEALIGAHELVVIGRAANNGGQPHADPRQVDLED